jgi:hypothetical protein
VIARSRRNSKVVRGSSRLDGGGVLLAEVPVFEQIDKADAIVNSCESRLFLVDSSLLSSELFPVGLSQKRWGSVRED